MRLTHRLPADIPRLRHSELVHDSLDVAAILPFTREHALAQGMTPRQWKTLANSGQLVRLRYGVYAWSMPSTDRLVYVQSIAAHLVTKRDTFATAESAAAIHRLPNPHFVRWSRLPIHLAGSKSRPEVGITYSRAAPVPTPWGLVTDLVDTADAIAERLPLPQALMVTDAVARRLAGTENRFELASEACRSEVRRLLTGRRDLPALRLADPAAESPAESFYRGHMILRDFPPARCGVPMLGSTGKQYFIDLLVEDLLIEVDGYGKYAAGGMPALIEEKRREDDLRATGRDFHRPFVEDIYADPDAEMDKLEAKIHVTTRRQAL